MLNYIYICMKGLECVDSEDTCVGRVYVLYIHIYSEDTLHVTYVVMCVDVYYIYTYIHTYIYIYMYIYIYIYIYICKYIYIYT
jgi:hypothetical protein